MGRYGTRFCNDAVWVHTLAAKDIRTLIRTLRAERYLLASESLADMASALLKLMSLPPDGNRPFSHYVRHMIGPARTLATIQRQLGGVLTPTARKELDRISSAVHLFLEERSDLVFYTAADDDGGTLLCASISDLTAQLQATLWSQPQPVLLTSGTLAIAEQLKTLLEEKQNLQTRIDAAKKEAANRINEDSRMAEYATYLEEHLNGFPHYDDEVVRKMIERVTVVDAETIRVKFRYSDLEIEQSVC